MDINQEILNAKPTDGLWDDDRSDEDQIGANYDDIEKVMKKIDDGEDPESFDVAAAVNGALFYYAIENIGASILEGLTSPLGDMITDNMAHEGVVLRNEELFGVKMVKITGNFIWGYKVKKFFFIYFQNRLTIFL